MSGESVNPLEYFVSGGFGGIVTTLVGHPFDTVKVRLQTQPIPKAGETPKYTGTWSCITQTVQKEGLLGLYKGIQAPLTGIVPIFAISFGAYGIGKKIFKADVYPNSLPRIFAAGAFSAIFTTTITAPIERVKCLLQIQEGGGAKKYDGMVDCAVKLYKEGGIKGIYKGTAATLLRDVPAAGVYFATYSYVSSLLTKPGEKSSLPVSILAGGTSGITHWIVGMPPDVIKSRLQTAPEGKYPLGMVSVFNELMKTEGPLGLYKGVIPVMLRAFPANAACFFGFEMCNRLFDYIHKEFKI